LMMWGVHNGYDEGAMWEAAAYGAVLEELERIAPGSWAWRNNVAV
jgi:hypothetical protein